MTARKKILLAAYLACALSLVPTLPAHAFEFSFGSGQLANAMNGAFCNLKQSLGLECKAKQSTEDAQLAETRSVETQSASAVPSAEPAASQAQYFPAVPANISYPASPDYQSQIDEINRKLANLPQTQYINLPAITLPERNYVTRESLRRQLDSVNNSGKYRGGPGFGESDVTEILEGGTGNWSSAALTVSGTITAGSLSATTLTTSSGLSLPSFSPSDTTDLLYNTSGDLYWDGNLVAGSAVGTWAASGGNAYRSTGKVGIGTTSPSATFAVETTAASVSAIRASIDGQDLLTVDNTENGRLRIDATGAHSQYLELYARGGGGGPEIVGGGDMYLSPRGDRFLLGSSGGNHILYSDSGRLYVTAHDSARVPLSVKGVASQSADLMQWLDSNDNVLGVMTATGMFGIGTTSPSAKLAITGSGTGTGRLFALANSANAEKLTVLDNGNVGINVTNPSSYTLEVNGTSFLGTHAYATYFRAPSDDLRFMGYNNGGGNYPIFGSDNKNGLVTQRDAQFMWSVDDWGNGRNGVDTGIARVSAGVVKITNGSSGDGSLLVGGNIGIGTTSPWGLLSITPTASVPAFVIGTTTNPNFIVTNSRVGIGTTTPSGKLSVKGNGTGLGYLAYFTDSANVPRFMVTENGAVGIGTTTTSFTVQIHNSTAAATQKLTSSATTYSALYLNDMALVSHGLSSGTPSITELTSLGSLAFSSNNTTRMTISAAGNIGIATTTPGAKFSVVGTTYLAGALIATSTVKFTGVGGSGTLSVDAAGNVTSASDERLKDIQGNFSRGLVDIQKIEPISYRWKDSTGYDTLNTYTGFSAQNVEIAIPEAVMENSQGMLSLQERPILAALVNAVKEIGSISETFKEGLVTWFADATNGIQDLFTNTSHQQTLCVGEAEDETCITKAQLDALLELEGGSMLPETEGEQEVPAEEEPELPAEPEETLEELPEEMIEQVMEENPTLMVPEAVEIFEEIGQMEEETVVEDEVETELIDTPADTPSEPVI